MFRDTATPSPYIEQFLDVGLGEGASAALPDHVYLDAMGFGMGCCCLQVLPSVSRSAFKRSYLWQMTFQARSIQEARYIYDQLAVMTPIMLALSGSTRGQRHPIDHISSQRPRPSFGATLSTTTADGTSFLVRLIAV